MTVFYVNIFMLCYGYGFDMLVHYWVNEWIFHLLTQILYSKTSKEQNCADHVAIIQYIFCLLGAGESGKSTFIKQMK